METIFKFLFFAGCFIFLLCPLASGAYTLFPRSIKDVSPNFLSVKDSTNSFLKNKNAIYGTLGLSILAVANLNYERFLFYMTSKKKLAVSLRCGYGVVYELGGDDYDAYILMANFNFGKLNHFFEFGFGTGTLYSKKAYRMERSMHKNYPVTVPDPNRRDFIFFLPGASIGYKYYSNRLPIIIRTGASFPDGFYFSLGGIF